MQLVVVLCICVGFVQCVPFGVKEKNFESAPQCGVEASENLIHHNPWLVYLEYYNQNGLRSIRCAGTLIGSKHVVTAAHCVRKSLFTRLKVRLGEYDVSTEIDVVSGVMADPVVRIEVAEVVIHGGYDGFKDDIAVLVLGEDAPYTAPQCGVEASENLIHHNPWLVYLEYYNQNGLRSIRCAGTLIGSKHVVTAAHCVRKSLFTRLKVRLGEYDVSTEIDVVSGVMADPVVRIEVAEVVIHGGYDGFKDDIAVLVLGEDAPYTDFIRPICLPTGLSQKGDVFSAAGWGEVPYTHTYSHVKKIIPLPYWSTQDCQKVYKSTNLPENIICAGGEMGKDTCRGDSGGPLTLNKGKIELWGVTSQGNSNCGTEGSPGIYTSVKGHLAWVEKVVQETS